MKNNQDDSVGKALLSGGDAVISTGVMAALGVYLGRFLDEKFATSPWLTVTLAILGVVAGLARMIIKSIKAEEAEKKEGQ
jgi:F0F1-type ATP synthase assembly protein I